MKTGKIQEIVEVGTHPYDNKTMYDYTLKIDNGDLGVCTKGKPNFFTVGQTISYEITDNGQYGMKIKLEQEEQKPKNKGNRQKEDPIERFIGFSASYAKDLVESKIIELKDREANANIFFNWMVKKHGDNKPVQAPHTQPTTPVAQTPTSELITPEQIKLARTLWAKTGLNDEAWKKYVSETYKVSSSKGLTRKQASEFIDYIKTIEPMPLPTKPVDDDLPF